MMLTPEDGRKLDQNVQTQKGAPFPLGVEHYFALSHIEDNVQRSWYEYKVSCEGLSLRQLQQAIGEDLFGKIINRPTPKPPPPQLKPAPKIPPKPYKESPEEKARYKKLVKKIRGIINKAEAKGIPIRHVRHDLLECPSCGAFEDILCGD